MPLHYFGFQATASKGNHLNHFNELETELAEMKIKEEKRQAGIDEMKRKVQKKKTNKGSEKLMT